MLIVLVLVLVLILVLACLSGPFNHWPIRQIEGIGSFSEEVLEVVETLVVRETYALGVGSHFVVGVLVIDGVVIRAVEHLSAKTSILGNLIVEVEVAHNVGGVRRICVVGPDHTEVGLDCQTVVEQLFA